MEKAELRHNQTKITFPFVNLSNNSPDGIILMCAGRAKA
jgi:hypothetical protein